MNQGKCTACHIRWTWEGAPFVRDAKCPHCNRPLDRTTHKVTLPSGNLHTGHVPPNQILRGDPPREAS